MIVEDGTGVAGADSYVTVSFADDYFSARGSDTWSALDDAAKERALVRATDFIDNMFEWNGRRLTESQPLRFPRKGIFDYEGAEVTGIPGALMQSVCEAAAVSAGGGELFRTHDANGSVVSEKIGDLAFTYSKDGGDGRTLYDSVNTRLRGLYRDTGKQRAVSGRVERA